MQAPVAGQSVSEVRGSTITVGGQRHTWTLQTCNINLVKTTTQVYVCARLNTCKGVKIPTDRDVVVDFVAVVKCLTRCFLSKVAPF